MITKAQFEAVLGTIAIIIHKLNRITTKGGFIVTPNTETKEISLWTAIEDNSGVKKNISKKINVERILQESSDNIAVRCNKEIMRVIESLVVECNNEKE